MHHILMRCFLIHTLHSHLVTRALIMYSRQLRIYLWDRESIFKNLPKLGPFPSIQKGFSIITPPASFDGALYCIVATDNRITILSKIRNLAYLFMQITNKVNCKFQTIEECFASENHVLELIIQKNEGEENDYPFLGIL